MPEKSLKEEVFCFVNKINRLYGDVKKKEIITFLTEQGFEGDVDKAVFDICTGRWPRFFILCDEIEGMILENIIKYR